MPRCKTLEEMRALRCAPITVPPPPVPPVVRFPSSCLHAPPQNIVQCAAPCFAEPRIVPCAAPASNVLALCQHAPYDCARFRAPNFWCAWCLHRRLFPEQYADIC